MKCGYTVRPRPVVHINPKLQFQISFGDKLSKPRFEYGTLKTAVLTAKQRLSISSHDGLHVQRQTFVCAPSVQVVSCMQARYHKGLHLVLMLAHSSYRFISIKDVNVCLRTLHEYMYMCGRYACIISCSLLQKCRQGGQVTKPQLTGSSSSSCSSVSVTTAFAPQIRNTVTRPSKPIAFTKQLPVH
jgi:hypothetical protein